MSLAALKRPFSIRALPGLLLVLIPVIEFFSMGYKMLCARTAMSQRYELPQWRGWKELFIFGIIARCIQAICIAPAAVAFISLYFKAKSMATIQSINALPQLFAIRNMLILFLVCIILAAIFAPACVLNYAAEARFKAAFSMSTLRRMFSKAYLLGWLISGVYAIIAIAILFGFFFLASGMLQALPPILIASIILLVELIIFWLPSITYWTLLGEYWGKSVYRE